MVDILPRAKQQQRVAFADFSAAPWQGFEKSERGPNNSSLFQPQAAVVVVALWLCLRHKCRRLVRGSLPRTKRKTSTQCVLVFLGAPNHENPNLFSIGEGFGFFVFFGNENNGFSLTAVCPKPYQKKDRITKVTTVRVP